MRSGPDFKILVLGLILVVATTGCAGTGGAIEPPGPISLGPLPSTIYQAADVDTSSEPVGGMGAVQAKIKYPESARRACLGGEVLVRYVVSEEGKVVQVAVEKGVDTRLDREALRVVSESTFTPARHQGQAVAIEDIIPISFRIQCQ